MVILKVHVSRWNRILVDQISLLSFKVEIEKKKVLATIKFQKILRNILPVSYFPCERLFSPEKILMSCALIVFVGQEHRNLNSGSRIIPWKVKNCPRYERPKTYTYIENYAMEN
jgi:hypothetical protein